MFDFSLINAPGSLMDPLLKEAELVTRALVLTNDQLARAQSLLMQSFHDGLKKDTHPVSPVKMFPTFVKEVPDGKDKYVEGKFLALDLGGTNFRVLLIEIDDEKLHHDSEIFSVPQEMMHGTGEELFDYIALCIHNFMEKRNIIQYRFPLGFTFSFPCKQEGLTSARLTTWTKGFKCTGVEGEDVVQLLKDAIERRDDIDVEVLAVVNDTTGTMVSCAHSNVDCRVGLIVGTGTNACYMETIENVEMCQSGEDEQNQVIVNTELGAFGENNALDYLRTHWDEEIDKNSINVGKQLFEKMVSGMYMGEIVRNVLIELIQRKILLNGQSSPELDTPKAFQTAFISAIESDAKGDYLYTTQVLHELNLRHSTKTDFDIVRLVCTRVSTRAANLVSAAVSTILNKMQRPYTTVAVDGSVYKYHPHFHDLMEKKVLELTDPNYKFDIKLSEDGSGRGAALVAAVATQQEIKRKISIGQRNHIQPVNRKNSRMELKQFITQFNETY